MQLAAIVLACGISAAESLPAPAIQEQLAAIFRRQMEPRGYRVLSVSIGCRASETARIGEEPDLSGADIPSLVVVAIDDGGKRRFCPCRIEAERQVLAASGDFEPGTMVSQSDFRKVWVAAARAGGGLSSFPFEGSAQLLARMKAGAILMPGFLQKPIVMQPNRLVKVEVKNGAVQIDSYMLSQSSGAVGDSIPFLNQETGKSLYARITGPDTASLEIE